MVVVVEGCFEGCFWEALIFISCDGVFGWSPVLLPRKEEVVDYVSHRYRVTNLELVRSHMLRHILHHLHCSKLVLCYGNLTQMMLVEIPRLTSTMCPTLTVIFVPAKHTPDAVSGTWICTRSGENYTEYIRLLFCAVKIILRKSWLKNTE